MTNSPHDALAELKRAYANGQISAATYNAMVEAYQASQHGDQAAGERGVAIGGDVSGSTILTGDHARTTSASTYIEHQTIFHAPTDPKPRDLQALLGKITAVTMAFMMDIQFAHVQPTAERYTILNDAYRVWEIESKAIQTALRIQTQSTSVVKEWESFAFAVTCFYALAGTDQQQQENSQLAIHTTIAHFLPAQQSRGVTWANLRAGLLEWHDQFIEGLISTRLQ